MAQWVTQTPIDLDVVEESALAMAQATIYNAMAERGIKPAKLAKNMGRHRAYVSRILSGSHNLTVKTFARALAASGYELRLSYAPLSWGWVADEKDTPAPDPHPKNSVATVSTEGGHFGVRNSNVAHSKVLTLH